ncbi:unnamed protein product [Camellia sinensis]
MCKDSKPKESGGKGKGKQARGGSDNTASKGKGKGAKTDGLGTCTYVKASSRIFSVHQGRRVEPWDGFRVVRWLAYFRILPLAQLLELPVHHLNQRMDTTLCCRKGGRIDRTWHSKLGSPGLLTIKSNGRLGHKIAPFGASSASSAEDEASQTSWPSAVATCADSAVS